jgi:hypothetical protein
MFLRKGRFSTKTAEIPAPVQTFPDIPTPRVLMLILASDTAPVYLEHQRLWRTYMKSNPNVDCYFYKGDPDLEEETLLVEDTLFIKIEDTLETVHEKTLRAFEYFAPTFSKYKCIFRTNLSSVVILDRYVEYCKTIPPKWFCSAYIGDLDGTMFPAGAGYTITTDIANKLIKEQPPLIVQDDVSLGHALKEWGIPITRARRLDFITEQHYDAHRGSIGEDIFHFRIKQNSRHEDGIETPYELELMQNLISQYYDDPPTRRIEVIMRMCSDAHSAQSGSGSRPEWFTKEDAFRSAFLTRGANVYFTVLFDGDASGHWLYNYPVTVLPFIGGTDERAFVNLLEYIRSKRYPDNTILYCLEDDYPHRSGWASIVREGLGQLTPSHMKFDYITLYDHRDKYTYEKMYKDLTSKIAISESVHWRTIPSTTNTFITLSKTLNADMDMFFAYKNLDNDKFLALGRKGRVIGSCIPGYSTHAHTEHMTPHLHQADMTLPR